MGWDLGKASTLKVFLHEEKKALQMANFTEYFQTIMAFPIIMEPGIIWRAGLSFQHGKALLPPFSLLRTLKIGQNKSGNCGEVRLRISVNVGIIVACWQTLYGQEWQLNQRQEFHFSAPRHFLCVHGFSSRSHIKSQNKLIKIYKLRQLHSRKPRREAYLF